MNQNKVSFETPPVVETVLGVQFEPVKGMTNAHMGLFWASLGSDWPHVEDAPPIEEQREIFGETLFPASFIRFSQDPVSRLRIKNAEKTAMIQLQPNRFHYNWLGQAGDPYPGYEEAKPKFDQYWSDFRKFVTEQSLVLGRANQWEITYVNHIPKDTVWEGTDDWDRVFTKLPGPFSLPNGTTLGDPGGRWYFEIEPQRGRLHIELNRAHLQAKDGQEAYVLKLTARGPVKEGSDEGRELSAGLQLGHDVIVSAFCELITGKARKAWGQKP